jgi:(1->4)-alpha-D-glucan 1-alpha-D-glucosylmutase
MPDEWFGAVCRWSRLNRAHRREVEESIAPDANEEYLIYQTLAGAWPLPPDRLELYLEKALREAKTNTNWLEPNARWEEEVKSFARGLYDHGPFRASFDPFVERVAELGERIALAQTLLKLTCPGVPDVYQGDELWSLSLVDPDNRRAVDWDARRRALADLQAGVPPTREAAKLFLIWKTLQLRAQRPEAFAGAYEPVEAEDVCAFTRGGEVLVAVPLRPGARFDPPDGWHDTLDADLGVWLLDRSYADAASSVSPSST